MHLHHEGLADITISEPLPGMRKTIFSISSNGRQLIESLPKEYKDKPYTYYLKLKNDTIKKQEEKDELDTKVKLLTINQAKFQWQYLLH